MIAVLVGDMREKLRELADNSIDSCVCDPPYHLTSIVKRFGAAKAAPAKSKQTGAFARASKGFMGQTWDGGDLAFQAETWAEVWRVLKPGGHLVAFSGTRTYHRMAVAIEDAGFEVRDMICWHYGSGFPKSHDISKAIDKAAGAEREVVGKGKRSQNRSDGWDRPWMREQMESVGGSGMVEHNITAPATDAAREWAGWGTALKPASEPVLCGAKPVTAEQHFAIVLHELTVMFAEAVQWSNSSASDAEKYFTATLAKLRGAASSVLDSAKIRSLESIGIASSAARSFTLQPLASDALTRTRDGSALSHVRPSGSPDRTREPPTPAGEAVDLLTALLDTSTCVTAGDMSANIALSWLGISDAILSQSSKFTIETVTRLTTALRTLSFSLRLSISADTGNSGPDTQPICLARKPLSGKSIAANVLRWGTGALNIDATRIEATDGVPQFDKSNKRPGNTFDVGSNRTGEVSTQGRWPANLCHDGSDEVVAGFPETTSGDFSQRGQSANSEQPGGWKTGGRTNKDFKGDSGSAARFFYCAKAGKLDRLGSTHPTVKPVALMRWLVRLVTPAGGAVLDPFAGSGSTGIAAFVEGFDATLVELREEAAEDIRRRIDHIQGLGRMTVLEIARNDLADEAKSHKARGGDLPLFAE